MPRGSIMKHLAVESQRPVGNNVGFIFARNAPVSEDFAMIHVVDKIFDHSILSTQTSTIATVAPLYLYDEADSTWKHNFNDSVFYQLTEHMTHTPSPIEIFDYAYGLLQDPVYRLKFNEYLKRGFPRIPVINNPGDKNTDGFYVSEDMFRSYAAAGERLRRLHLMQVKCPAAIEMLPNTPDNLEIGAVKHKNGELSLNAKKHIIGISDDVWNYRIGGYRVLEKWFKSHKGKTLDIERFTHIENVVGLLAETIKIQSELEALHA